MIKTRKSDPNKPPRILIYGVEGVGKSTLGAKSDSPIFISPEGGTDRLSDCNGNAIEEMPNVNNWNGVLSSINQLLSEQHDFKTLVIDSLDWLESLAHTEIIGNSGKTIITCGGGYGSGYRQSQNMHKALLDGLSALRERRGMGIIITAHAHVRAVKDPSMLQDYDQYEIKSHEMVASLFREWVDALLFARFRTFVKASEDTDRARAVSDGSRVVYTQKQPSFQAKNRYGLPAEMDFTENYWKDLKRYTGKLDTLEVVMTEILEMETLITDDKTKEKIFESIKNSENQLTKLIPIRNRLREITGSK